MTKPIKIVFFSSVLLLTVSCMPSDAYKASYEKQDISYSLGLPLSKKDTESLIDHPTYEMVDGKQKERKSSYKRKNIGDTMVFFNQEDNNKFFTKE